MFTEKQIEYFINNRKSGTYVITADQVIAFAEKRGWKSKKGKPYRIETLINCANGALVKNPKSFHIKYLEGRYEEKIPTKTREQVIERKPISVNSGFYRSWAWKKVRFEVLNAFGPTCMLCGAVSDDGVRICVDHIFPVALYPELALDRSNMQVLCNDCNMGKSRDSFKDYRKEWQKKYFANDYQVKILERLPWE